MCYKHLWDSLVDDDFPSRQFFEFFSLNPNRILSAEIRENTAKCGFPAEVSPKKNEKFLSIIYLFHILMKKERRNGT